MTTTLEHFLTNKTFRKMSEECGIILDGDNYTATGKEIEFLLEKVVKECASMVENSSHKSTDQITADILEHFYL